MDWALLIVLADCAIMSTIAALLMWIKHYQDGIFGNAGFACIIFASVCIWADVFNGGDSYEVDAVAAILITGTALFMTHHFYRYCRFYHWPRKKDRADDSGARCAR